MSPRDSDVGVRLGVGRLQMAPSASKERSNGLCTRKVLVMERVAGRSINAVMTDQVCVCARVRMSVWVCLSAVSVSVCVCVCGESWRADLRVGTHTCSVRDPSAVSTHCGLLRRPLAPPIGCLAQLQDLADAEGLTVSEYKRKLQKEFKVRCCIRYITCTCSSSVIGAGSCGGGTGLASSQSGACF